MLVQVVVLYFRVACHLLSVHIILICNVTQMFVMSRHVVSMNGTSSTGLCIDDTVDYCTDINQINLFQGKQV